MRLLKTKTVLLHFLEGLIFLPCWDQIAETRAIGEFRAFGI